MGHGEPTGSRDAAAGEARLAAVDEQFRLIVEAAPNALVLVGADGRIGLVNAEAERLFGYAREELVGREIDRLVPERFRRQHAQHRAMFAASPQARPMGAGRDLFALRKDGDEVPVEIGLSPMATEAGRHVLISLTDITARKSAETALQAREVLLRAATDNAAVGLVLLDRARRYTFVNAAYIDILKLPCRPEDLIGKGPAEVLTPVYASQISPHLDRAFAGERVTYELARTLPYGGETRHYAVVHDPLREQAGAATGVIVTMFDITERKRIEQDLRNSQKQLADRLGELQTFLEVSPIGISLAFDATCQNVWVNPALRALLRSHNDAGPLAHREQAAPYRVLRKGEPVSPGDMPMQRCCARGEPILDEEIEIVFDDGAKRTLLESAQPLFDEKGGVRGCIAFDVDITERKRSEENIGMLMREVNHRAKNLLSVVQAVARQTAKTGDPDAFVERLTDRIKALAASHDLLVRSEWRGVEMFDLVASQLEHLQDLIGSRILLNGPPARVNSNAAQAIGLALHELATNSGKYGALSGAQGGVRVSWSIESGDAGHAFRMEWREHGGPAVEPPQRTGFGYVVTVRMAEYALSGKVDLDFARSGLVWRLKTPAHRILETGYR